jgi:hypothetical protein
MVEATSGAFGSVFSELRSTAFISIRWPILENPACRRRLSVSGLSARPSMSNGASARKYRCRPAEQPGIASNKGSPSKVSLPRNSSARSSCGQRSAAPRMYRAFSRMLLTFLNRSQLANIKFAPSLASSVKPSRQDSISACNSIRNMRFEKRRMLYSAIRLTVAVATLKTTITKALDASCPTIPSAKTPIIAVANPTKVRESTLICPAPGSEYSNCEGGLYRQSRTELPHTRLLRAPSACSTGELFLFPCQGPTGMTDTRSVLDDEVRGKACPMGPVVSSRS